VSSSDLREQLSKAAHTPVHYMVNCHYDESSQRLYLIAGDNGFAAPMFVFSATAPRFTKMLLLFVF
jgi:hypothetical protein